jgi:hypothetical protein
MENDLIAKLKLIGILSNGDKINTKYMIVQPGNDIITKISRTLYKDDRQDTLEFLTSTVQKSFELMSIQTDKNKDKNTLCNIFALNIYKDLNLSIEGLQRLKKTYEDDKLFTCKLECLIEDTQAKLKDYFVQNTDLFN